MNRISLINCINKKTWLPKNKARRALNTLLDVIKEELINNNKLSLTGLGVFDSKMKKARKYKDINSGEVLQTPPKRVPVFSLNYSWQLE